eukprot:scaffold1651_cov182-Chaetoceros_neogracile.AAC.1
MDDKIIDATTLTDTSPSSTDGLATRTTITNTRYHRNRQRPHPDKRSANRTGTSWMEPLPQGQI